MIAVTPPTAGDKVSCDCCGKEFTFAVKNNGGIDVIIGRFRFRAALCQRCHEKTWRSRRKAESVAERVLTNHRDDFTAISMLDELVSLLLGAKR